LTQEVALGSQLKERRRQVHAAVARAIEQQHPEHLDERAPLLAHHYEQAGAALAAARWHRRAAEWVGATDFAAATHHWGRVRALHRELPDDHEAAALGIAACMQLLNMSWRVGVGLDEAHAVLEEGEAFARSIADRIAAVYLSMMHARAVCGAGDVATYLALTVQNERTALEVGDEAALALARMWVVDALSFGTRFPEALRKADEVLLCIPRHVPAAHKVVGIHPHPVVVFWRGYCLYWMGRLEEGLDALAIARRMSDDDGTPEMAAYSLTFIADACRLAHDVDGVLASAHQVEEISRRLGEPPVLVALAQLTYGYAHLAAGRPADAIEPARAALHLHGLANKENAGLSAALLAEALLQAGDLAAAQSAAEQAIALCRRSLRGNYEAEAHGVLARALLRRDGPAARDAAEAALANAAALVERTGAKTLAPALCEWRAELAGVLGDEATRVQLLRQAQQGYAEIGATGHAARLARALGE
jgi:adenylate cyclase